MLSCKKWNITCNILKLPWLWQFAMIKYFKKISQMIYAPHFRLTFPQWKLLIFSLEKLHGLIQNTSGHVNSQVPLSLSKYNPVKHVQCTEILLVKVKGDSSIVKNISCSIPPPRWVHIPLSKKLCLNLCSIEVL